MKKHLTDMSVMEAFAPGTDLRASSNSPRESDWVDLAEHDSCVAVIQAIADADAGNVTVSWRQATSAAGAGNKELDGDPWYVQQGSTLPGTYAAGATLTGNAKNVAVGEVTADQLDVAGGYRYVAVRISRAAANGKLASGALILSSGRYQQRPDTQPSPLA